MGWEEVAIDIAESNKEGFHTFKLDFIPVPAMSIAVANLPNGRIQASRVEEKEINNLSTSTRTTENT